MNKKVAVIIVTYNGEYWLDSCISLIYKQDNVSIIVIDNASTDKTIDKIKISYPDVVLIESKINLGFGAANNIGFNYAINNNFDFVFLLNQDASITFDNLSKLVEQYLEIESIGILSPIHYKNNDDIENVFKSYLLESNLDLLCEENKIEKIGFVNAAIWLISINVLKKVGGFNPLYYHYGEDNDFVNRVKYWGYDIFIATNIKGFHFRHYDKKKIRQNSSIKRHFGPWHLKYYLIVSNLNITIIEAIYKCVLLFIKSLVKHFFEINFNSIKWDFKIFKDVIYQFNDLIRNRNRSKEKKAFL